MATNPDESITARKPCVSLLLGLLRLFWQALWSCLSKIKLCCQFSISRATPTKSLASEFQQPFIDSFEALHAITQFTFYVKDILPSFWPQPIVYDVFFVYLLVAMNVEALPPILDIPSELTVSMA